MDTEKDALVRCREMIEQALNWGPSSHWSNLDFDNLSEKILEKTQERLSVSTLKRIWGKVRYDSTPTLATLNVLARFLDYENWRDFHFRTTADRRPQPTDHSNPLNTHSNAPLNTTANVSSAGSPPQTVHRRPWTSPARMRMFIGTAAAMLVGLFVFLFVRGKTPPVDESGVTLTSRKVSDELPNSVVFTYDIGNLPADSVFIQQSWDPRRRERVSPTGKHHTSMYYRPGHFLAKLIVNDVIKKEDTVFIKTKGWKGIIDGDINTPVYLGETETQQPGGMGIDRDMLRDKIKTSIFTNRWTVFHNVREFDGLDHQNFTLDMKLRNTATVEECLCRKVSITLLQKGSAIMIPLAAHGCISDIDLLTPTRYLPGKTNDLSAFGCNFPDFVQVRCQVAAGIFSITLNNNIVLEEKITQPLAELVGIRIGFEGTGEIQYVQLASPGKIILNDQFNTVP